MKKLILFLIVILSGYQTLKTLATPPPRPNAIKPATKPLVKKHKPTSGTINDSSKNNLIPMVYVKGGSFNMGSTQDGNDAMPIHRVTLSSFYMGKYEVNQAQWKMIMGNSPSYFFNCDDCPVEQVSWEDAMDFIEKLNQQTQKHYRLPTEAEWEYAARGGNKSNGYTYSGSNEIADVAWYTDNSGNKTHPQGQKQANELGIYDMSGNVWEWCGDRYDANYYSKSPAKNPKGPSLGVKRVYRGGSWRFTTRPCRVVYRLNLPQSKRFNFLGFRLVLVP